MPPIYFNFGQYVSEQECTPCQAMAALAKAAAALVRLWAKRQRERRARAGFDARMLRDIGVTPSEAAHEIGKPFWRA
ncbi:MAG TPA: DUF1127 domain-containing protein [Stellaceae bacterium]|nr:DUF1127 domain-containing protein [Stellaceae bacterium]